MIKKILFSIFCICLLSIVVFADEVNPIDKTEDVCISKTSSTADMLKCTATAYDFWDKEIN